MEAILYALVSLLFAGNLWWMRRLVVSNDAFRKSVYERLGELDDHRARVEERHRLEDSGVLGRRSYDQHKPGS